MKNGIKVERISNSLARILFDTKQYRMPQEAMDDSSYFDTFIPEHTANVGLDLVWAGIIEISANTVMLRPGYIDSLIDKVTNTLQTT